MADAEHSDPEHFNVAEQRLISLTGSVFTKPSFLATVANAVGGRSSNIRDRQGLEDMGGYPPDRAAGGLWFNRFSSSWDDLRTASDSNEFRPRTFSALAAVGLREEDVPWLSCNGSTVDFTVEVAVFDHPTSSLIPHKQRLV
ncbi:unnamed protein product [Zymoseptoria tritici ST99CH_3D7]|uniref:Uncharacterized protein n=3 Tax=Zymoseptoria tritici TaxID=1047171 RepID=A0A1X7RMR7_ZYMT9|nr:unnamed protein product [Zymoseptoria tritici ST99CH_3D7]